MAVERVNPAMPPIRAFFQRLRSYAARPALVWRAQTITYGELLRREAQWRAAFPTLGIRAGTVCAYSGDYWPDVVAFTLALINGRAIAMPLPRQAGGETSRLIDLAQPTVIVRFEADGTWTSETRHAVSVPGIIDSFRRTSHPGLVVFTSGSSGQPRGILHDFLKLLGQFEEKRTTYRTLLFLLLDHFGGINTLFRVLCTGGTGLTAETRTVEDVCRAVEESRIELLPVTPAFLALLVASDAAERFDLSSIKLITYGADTMSADVLRRVVSRFGTAKLQQTYGLSELGVLRSQSKHSASLLVRVGGRGFQTKVVNGVLHVKSPCAMVGYLNAPNPFDTHGWFNTGDAVEQDGEFLRVLGRTSDVINVGGQKVFPAEVENVLTQAPNVIDATVHAMRHPIMGQAVIAHVTIRTAEDDFTLRRRLRQFCLKRLAPHKVPVRIVAAIDEQKLTRFKKVRHVTD